MENTLIRFKNLPEDLYFRPGEIQTILLEVVFAPLTVFSLSSGTLTLKDELETQIGAFLTLSDTRFTCQVSETDLPETKNACTVSLTFSNGDVLKADINLIRG